MSKFSGGWIDLQNSMPMPISDRISLAIIEGGGTTEGEVKMVSDYNSPTGGSWTATALSINAEPIN